VEVRPLPQVGHSEPGLGAGAAGGGRYRYSWYSWPPESSVPRSESAHWVGGALDCTGTGGALDCRGDMLRSIPHTLFEDFFKNTC